MDTNPNKRDLLWDADVLHNQVNNEIKDNFVHSTPVNNDEVHNIDRNNDDAAHVVDSYANLFLRYKQRS